MKLLIVVVILSQFISIVFCFLDPISIGLSIAASAVISYLASSDKHGVPRYERVEKYIGQTLGYYEGCEDYWITGNIKGLEHDLMNNTYGQSLAVELVLAAMRNHLRGRSERSLVLSFHGPPGTGKNFFSNKILKNMFRNGVKTEYVHFFRSSIDFPIHSEINLYKKNIINNIMKKVYECRRSIFVFDEVEKMPDGILDVITGLVESGTHGEYDFRRVIFILLTNIGSEALVRVTYDSVKNGIKRENMNAYQLSKLLAKEAFNAKGGLKNSELIKSSIVSQYVPFLPLEREHVVQCLRTEVFKQHQIMSDELTQQVLDELTFIPEPDKLFAFGGCKGVAEKASMLIEREIVRRRRRYS